MGFKIGDLVTIKKVDYDFPDSFVINFQEKIKNNNIFGRVIGNQYRVTVNFESEGYSFPNFRDVTTSSFTIDPEYLTKRRKNKIRIVKTNS